MNADAIHQAVARDCGDPSLQHLLAEPTTEWAGVVAMQRHLRNEHQTLMFVAELNKLAGSIGQATPLQHEEAFLNVRGKWR